ncbi:hypothetical protein AWJ20_1243 [Sugiyamaella lignohabitans]|uniref:Ribonucleases P/MRP subunit Pop8-like domain-containing protein n=1 Tax=Sugiyamaella lignohabitans TaxID=796027 RepID=A0A167DIV3_9ASCO|nr:uncharacterized protein AWJ20_1243 [Sugiyamaella lignohabitans]ANB12965.1 hypothetical protein AWJ20_1243 [Sugiyamaella lignohabitans]
MAISRSLNTFLGISGTAIPVDLLHILDKQAWVRVPAGDLDSVWNALSGAVVPGSDQLGEGAISVVRASRYLSALVGPRRGKWT